MFTKMMGVNQSSFLKVHWLNSNANLPRAGHLFVDVRSELQVAIPVINDGVRRRNIKGGGRITIYLANDLLTHNLMCTHILLSVMKNGHWEYWRGGQL